MAAGVAENPHIGSITYLKSYPRTEVAHGLLHDIYKSISYLMRENHLKVQTLAEFYPKNGNLLGLNVNAGQKILLRLRCPGDPQSFLPRDQIMQVMVHELTHNRVGPHNAAFKKQMAEWCGRQYVIETLGLVDCFLGQGRKLGGVQGKARIRHDSGRIRKQRLMAMDTRKLGNGSASSKESTHSAREMAAKAALSRLDRGTVTKIPRFTMVEKIDDTDAQVDVEEVLELHGHMDTVNEDIIVLDDDDDDDGNENGGTQKSTPQEIIDLT
ncbi:metalloendopeptidase WSS1 KNAG_0H03700 [Huiozyma naganishii CBS 8797]|uniref:WLM domain-containing protein n=1 Tax=Huiozyma naganishii (strain ATCC MYA-139 / BCRC 22969 / CBS 8797 / KCTC 17520 / NBRC 10181 / NCYC 3082 / Yp74L-3) TaxID=1071383 RepID=J7S8W8_HUIN7|nr:hypothetical protein KNAG_0H03700 [Kazachstania naganishii CBS 8797]CCK71784.1 hypothetical protein KNAG_0H03700 [Kazachstania naganishii CBS 8797]